MFKGLRSKLEDEAKRIQSNVTHYGENLANQVRSSASEAGSDISFRARKLLDTSQQQDKDVGHASNSNALSADDSEQKLFEKKLEEEKQRIVNENSEKIALIEKQHLEDKQIALTEQQKILEENYSEEKKKIIDEYEERMGRFEKEKSNNFETEKKHIIDELMIQHLEDKQIALSVLQKKLEEKFAEEKKILIDNYEERIGLIEKGNKEAKDNSFSEQKTEDNIKDEKQRIVDEYLEKIKLIEKQFNEDKNIVISELEQKFAGEKEEIINKYEEKIEQFESEKQRIINESSEKIVLLEKQYLEDKQIALTKQQKILEENYSEEKRKITDEYEEKIGIFQKEKSNNFEKEKKHIIDELMIQHLEDKQIALSVLQKKLEEKFEEGRKAIIDEYEEKIGIFEKENKEAKDYSLSEQKLFEEKIEAEKQRIVNEHLEKIKLIEKQFNESNQIAISELKQKFDEEKKEIINKYEERISILERENKEFFLLQQIENSLNDKKTELEEINKEFLSFKSAKSEEIQKLQNSIVETKEINLKEIAVIKKESEKAKQKAIADMKSEIKHLYDSINEKDCELASTHANISKLKEELDNLRGEIDKQNNSEQLKQNSKGSYDDDGVVDLDEFIDLKRRFIEQEEELLKLRALVQNGVKKDSPPTIRRDSNRSFHMGGNDLLNFAEPTEAEYLRNVLYRYMIEREYLGRESVTLAKVICTVCKFPPEQRNLVLRREEARCQRWLPGSIHALNLHQNQNNQRNNRQNNLNNWNISSSALLQTNNSNRPLANINALPYS
ncbi:hypothetical protein Mgra_00008197 [Meloidogyne graminicola]|uniref:GRIP domain-containing protein n=1 Tax=Meloidogyne graminicola TaxID=189291 RepID=A0A8S9ZGG8_9BILA|nr:hypothetical protein Mgra_00008197 [Meloidogyne graminicola]